MGIRLTPYICLVVLLCVTQHLGVTACIRPNGSDSCSCCYNGTFVIIKEGTCNQYNYAVTIDDNNGHPTCSHTDPTLIGPPCLSSRHCPFNSPCTLVNQYGIFTCDSALFITDTLIEDPNARSLCLSDTDCAVGQSCLYNETLGTSVCTIVDPPLFGGPPRQPCNYPNFESGCTNPNLIPTSSGNSCSAGYWKCVDVSTRNYYCARCPTLNPIFGVVCDSGQEATCDHWEAIIRCNCVLDGA